MLPSVIARTEAKDCADTDGFVVNTLAAITLVPKQVVQLASRHAF